MNEQIKKDPSPRNSLPDNGGRLLSALTFSLLLAAMMVGFYWPALQGGFIWDDDDHLTKNACIVGPLGLKELWTTQAARICPLVQTAFWLEYRLWGLNPWPYHLVNVLLFAASAVVLWRVLQGLNVRGAWIGAALWALHPVQVESVAWITEQKNTQSGLFFLLAILFFVKSLKMAQFEDSRTSRMYYAFALAAGLLAMASKSSTVVLPVVLGLCAWWIERCWRWRNLWKLAPFFVMAAATGALSMWTQRLEGASGLEWARTFAERIITAGWVVWFYLGKLVWPQPLIFIYPRWKIDPTQFASYFPALAAIFVFFVLWRKRGGWGRPYFFAFSYFVVALFPVLGLLNHFFLKYSFVGDHFQYLASMGMMALAGAGIATVTVGGRYLQPLISGGLVAVLGVLTWQRSYVFHDNEVLWRDTLARNPSSWLVYNNLACELISKGRLAEAVALYRQALRLRPDDAVALSNLGVALARAGQFEEAIEYYQKSLRINPADPECRNALGLALMKLGRVEEAAAELRWALNLKPGYAEASGGLGIALFRLGRNEEAIGYLRQALRTNPDDTLALSYLGIALVEKKQYDEAIMYLRRAIERQPKEPGAYFNLGKALALKGDRAEAIENLRTALRFNPDYTEARQQLRELEPVPSP